MVTLDARCRARFLDVIKRIYRDGVLIAPYFLPDLETWSQLQAAEKVLPAKLAEIGLAGDLPEHVVSQFLFDEIRPVAELVEKAREQQLTELRLSDIFADSDAAAGKTIERFETLPWSYTAIFRTPFTSANITQSPISIADGALVELFGRESEYPLETHDDTFGRIFRNIFEDVAYPEKWEERRIYLLLTRTGYVASTGFSPLIEGFKNSAKGFFGFCLSLKLCDIQRQHFGLTASPIILYRDDNTRSLIRYRTMSRDESETLRDMNVAVADPAEATKLLWAISAAFELSLDGALVSAARWIFDSFCGPNELLSFVQVMISLEILLGATQDEAEEVGVTALLANRCAYLIGATANERATILSTFRQIYKTRSQIVHRGKWLLTSGERRSLNTLRELSRRTLLREFRLLYNEHHG